MKIILNIEIPNEPFNSMVRAGNAGQTMAAILDGIKPEAAYFHAPGGHRGATMIVDIDDPSEIPSIAEPFFLKLNARCKFDVVMSPQELARGGLEELGKKWA